MTYDEWLRELGVPAEDRLPPGAAPAFRKGYEWAKKHPKADRFDVMREVGKHLGPAQSGGGESIVDHAKDIVTGKAFGWSLVPKGAGDFITDLVHPSTAMGTSGKPSRIQAPSSSSDQKGAAPDPVAPPASPDAQSALATAAKSDPALQKILDAALAGGVTGGTVSLWPQGVGVDPDAQVFGITKARPIQRFTPGSEAHVPGTAINRNGRGDSTTIRGGPSSTQTADAWLKGLYTMDPMDLADLQKRLYAQGWYKGLVTDPSQIAFGRPDEATMKAYGSVLGDAARYLAAGRQIGIDDVIDLGSPNKGIGTGTPFERTNPANLDEALRSEAQNSLGRDPTPAELAGYRGSFGSEEDAARRALITADEANQTVGITGPPSPSAGAAEYVDLHNLADKVAYGAAVRQQAFFSMLKSPV